MCVKQCSRGRRSREACSRRFLVDRSRSEIDACLPEVCNIELVKRKVLPKPGNNCARREFAENGDVSDPGVCEIQNAVVSNAVRCFGHRSYNIAVFVVRSRSSSILAFG